MLEAYFEPLAAELVRAQNASPGHDYLGSLAGAYTTDRTFPSFEGARIALIGVGEERGSVSNAGCGAGPDAIREKFYRLRKHQQPLPFIDLGNLRLGKRLGDTYAAIATVVNELLREHIIPVILGGSQDLTYGHYGGYKLSEQIINIAALDARFDLGVPEDPTNSETYLGKIILEQPNYLFNFSNLGYQSYFTGAESVSLMKKLHFETYRLGQVQSDIQEAEPIVRNADLLTVDLTVVRQSDAPGNANASPNGLYGEELCQILMYAGLSDKLSGIGLYEYNPAYDRHGQSSQLYAHALWYFMEGVGMRKNDLPLSNTGHYITYRVALEEIGQEITFIKSTKSERWWMKLPTDGARNRYLSQHLLPCSYRDYQQACSNEVPERWWNAVHKMV
ncbi:MAG: formimidoylglutamase [Bacteroidia bacterium]|nr:formimidoylglutamase [Bacteroidia bacterium]